MIETQEPGVRIIDKTGPLANPADRDHCIQYMVAVPLIFGRLTAADYEDAVAADPRIDALRAKMQVRENPTFTREYYAADKRYIGNAVQVFFKDGTHTERVRWTTRSATAGAAPRACRCWCEKFEAAVAAHFAAKQAERIKALFANRRPGCHAGERVRGRLGHQRGPAPNENAPTKGAFSINPRKGRPVPPLLSLADLHRHEQPRIAALDQQCHVALGLLHGRAQLVGGGDRRTVGREHHIPGLDAGIRRWPAHPLDHDAA